MSRAPRILVLSASVGAGHLRAAQAIELALKELSPQAEVHNIDVLQLTNGLFRKLYGQLYFDLVRWAPHLLGYFYDVLDRPYSRGGFRDWLRLTIQRFNMRRFERLLTEQAWDIAVSTHFLPPEIIANLRRKGRLSLRQFTVTTDFDTHRMWVHEPCERYFTATEEGARYLHVHGVPLEDTTVTGIPVHPVFAQPKDPAECRKRHGVGSDRPVILQLAGGLGVVGPVRKLAEAVLALRRPVDLVIVCGKNTQLKEQMQSGLSSAIHRIHVLGFTDHIDELMAAADLVVSKPGGLTTSEVLARGAAMVIVSPIPGQEFRNSDYLLERGAAIKVNNVQTLTYKIETLLDDPARLAAMKANALAIARPRAAYEVARAVLEMVR